MSALGGFSAGLAYLPNWLNESRDAVALEALLSGWVRSSGWSSAGLVWPADSANAKILLVRPDGVEKGTITPPELPDVLKSLKSGTTTLVWQVPGTSGRLYTLLSPSGRPSAVVWIERNTPEPWADVDRNYLRLAAKLIERSPALTALTGAAIEPERLNQRLADASLIAGRMAHDFDNILTGIIGFADLSVPLLPPGSQQARFVTEIGKVGHRGIHFTQQLHQLSRSGQSKPHTASVLAALTKEEIRLRPGMQAGMQVVCNLPTALNSVAIESGSLGVIIGHLLENATDATPAGGRVVVSGRLLELSPTDARTYLGQVSQGPHVEITVQDTGSGIKPDIRARLFVEPFYTTKVRRRGLGLAVVYRTLCAHRGGIRIEPASPTEPGTTVRVVLPPAAARPAFAPPAFATTSVYGG